jgi:hypothetical protein
MDNKTQNPEILLAEAMERAKEAADKFINVEDGGSCNLDSVVIRLPYWSKEKIKKANTLANGISIDSESTLSSTWFKGYRWVNIGASGQGDRRTKMVEAAAKELKNSGFDIRVYYQMD